MPSVNIGYSMGLKNEPILDLALVSAGFVLRAIAGGVATGVPLSNWFIIVACFGALLIVTGKRSGEKKLLSTVKIDQGATRQILGIYTPEFLRGVLDNVGRGHCDGVLPLGIRTGLDGPVTVTTPSGSNSRSSPSSWRSSTSCACCNSGAGAAPEDLAMHDHRLQIFGLCWVVLFVVATYS